MELDLFETQDPVLEVLDYARFHGLCRNYLTEQPSFHDVEAPSDETLEADLDGLMHLSLTDLDSKLIKERLTVNKEAALLLKAVHSLQQQDDVVESTIPSPTRSSLLKQEVPLLRCDHELDLQAFGNTNIPSFSNLRIPMETIDIEKDEGLEWPSNYQAYPAICDRELKREKISISKDVLLFLQDAVRDTWTQQDSEEAIARGLRYQRASKGTSLRLVILTLPEQSLGAINTSAAPIISAFGALHSILTRKSSGVAVREHQLYR
jgi:hypothetical protein